MTSNHRWRYAQLIIGQMHVEPLDRFRFSLGGNGFVTPVQKNGMYYWICGKRGEVAGVVELLMPWLCSIKQAQIERVLAGEIRASVLGIKRKPPPFTPEGMLCRRLWAALAA